MFLTRAKHVLVDPGGTVKIHGDVATAPTVTADLDVTSKEAKLEMHGSLSGEVCR